MAMATDRPFGGWSWNFPLSGPVTQGWRTSIGQLGFININTMESADRDVEVEIIEKVAGYGKQLGRIGEALSVLLAHTKLSGLNPGEQRAVTEFVEMAREIAAVKVAHGVPTEENLNHFVDGLRYVKDHDPGAYERMLDRLREEVFDGGRRSR
jgi:hypothetical protein